MKLFDLIRKELVDVVRDRKQRYICDDTKKLCINVETANDFKTRPASEIIKDYGITRAEYQRIVKALPDSLEPVLDEDIQYKSEDEVLNPRSGLVHTMHLDLPPDALKRLNAIKKKNGYII